MENKRLTVADRVFESVRHDIVTGQITRNDMLSIYQLADRYNVSRTPVREAVLRLANVGLVVIEKNHGVRVRGLTASDVREIFQTRLLIEVPSAFHAAGSNPTGARERLIENMERLTAAAKHEDLDGFIQADRELHSTIISWNGNNKAARVIDQIRDESHSLGASTFDEGRSIVEVFEEHTPIYEAILGGQGKQAASLMRDHLLRTARILLAKVALIDEGSAGSNGVQTVTDEMDHLSPIIFIDL